MNDEYIKREDAIKVIVDYAVPQMYFPNGGDLEAVGECAKRVLNNAPSQDVAPVRHGRWEKNDYLFIDTLYRCSVCGEEFYLENGTPQENQYYYCPNCGARMDGESDE